MSATLIESAAPATSAPAGPAARVAEGPTAARWAGRVLSGIAVLFLAADAAMKLAGAAPAVDGARQLGFSPQHVLTLGLIQLACLVLYVIPRTAAIGAVLWTGYLGGAIATHLRLGHPLLTHTLFPLHVAALLWSGLYLRDARVRALLHPAR